MQLGVENCGAAPRGLIDLAKRAGSLEILLINGNKVSEEVVEEFANTLKRLKVLSCNNTGLSEKMLLKLVSGLLDLKVAYMGNQTRNSERNGLGESAKKAVNIIRPDLHLYV